MNSLCAIQQGVAMNFGQFFTDFSADKFRSGRMKVYGFDCFQTQCFGFKWAKWGLFTSIFDGCFHHQIISVPPILCRPFFLLNLPRRMRRNLLKSIGDPFLQFLIEFRKYIRMLMAVLGRFCWFEIGFAGDFRDFLPFDSDHVFLIM